MTANQRSEWTCDPQPRRGERCEFDLTVDYPPSEGRTPGVGDHAERRIHDLLFPLLGKHFGRFVFAGGSVVFEAGTLPFECRGPVTFDAMAVRFEPDREPVSFEFESKAGRMALLFRRDSVQILSFTEVRRASCKPPAFDPLACLSAARLPTPEWITRTTARILSRSHSTSRVIAAGFILRLWEPEKKTGTMTSRLDRANIFAGTTPVDGVRRWIDAWTLENADDLIAELNRLVDAYAARSVRSSSEGIPYGDELWKLVESRDELASLIAIVSILDEDEARATEFELAGHDRHFRNAVIDVEARTEDERHFLSCVAFHEPDAWWGRTS